MDTLNTNKTETEALQSVTDELVPSLATRVDFDRGVVVVRTAQLENRDKIIAAVRRLTTHRHVALEFADHE